MTIPPSAAPAPAPPPPDSTLEAVRALTSRRSRLAALLTAAMVAVYFGFLSLVAWFPALLARPVDEGLTLGVVLGALVIVAAWGLTLVYVRWANRVYDPALAALRGRGGDHGAA